MLKFIAALSLAALFSLSPAFAKSATPPPPVKSCGLHGTVAKALATAPSPETSRISGGVLAKFKADIKFKATVGSAEFPEEADMVIFFRIDDKFTAMMIAKGDCNIGRGLISTVLVPGEKQPDDGSI